MKVYIVMLIAITAIACTREATPVGLSEICSPENEKKYVVTTGFISDRGSIFCSNIGGGRMNCGLDVVPSYGEARVFGADIEQGDGSNKIAKLDTNYKKENVKILDNAGNRVGYKERVQLTGEMSIAPAAPGGQDVCFMKVDKIERLSQ